MLLESDSDFHNSIVEYNEKTLQNDFVVYKSTVLYMLAPVLARPSSSTGTFSPSSGTG